MTLAAWLLGLALLTLFFDEQLAEQRNPNRALTATRLDNGIEEILLQRNRFGHYLATGMINGADVEFLLDTGASDVSIPLTVAEQLGLEKGKKQFYQTANGTIQAWRTVLDELSLGGLTLRSVTASINPHMEGETLLLGMSALKALEFTQRGDTLIIRHYPEQ